MNKYNSYKDSGIFWIENYPSHWGITPIKNKYFIGRGRVISNDDLKDDGLYPVFSSQTKSNGCLGYINSFDFDDKLITWTTDGANAGTVFLREGKFNCTNVCGTLKPKNNNVKLEFDAYFLKFATQFYKRPDTNGAKIMNNEMAVIITLNPPIHEQEQIVAYLDKKTAIVDTLITSKEEKINLLKEKRTALINHVITKGLDPNVKFKDSGVDWIGEIPAHWEMKKIFYFGKVTLGKMLTPVNKGGDFLKFYLRSKNIQNEKVDISDIKEMWFSENELNKLRLLKNDLLLNEGGDVGRTCIWNDELEECYFQNSVNIIRFEYDNPNFFLFVSMLYHTVGHYDSLVNRVSIPHLTKEKLESVRFIRPSFKEQQQIVEYLNTHTQEIDELISLEQKKIDTLKEYCQALISEVVTGKIKVVK